MNLAGKLHSNTYADDEPVGLASIAKSVLPGPIADEEFEYIPQQLWHRLLSLGEAYALNYGSVLDPVLDCALDTAQCESLAEDLRFVSATVNDDALHATIAVILRKIEKVQSHSGMVLLFSPP